MRDVETERRDTLLLLLLLLPLPLSTPTTGVHVML
jgi:hypothetical protein